MRDKKSLVDKIKGINKKYSDEEAIQIANFLMSLSEVYYDVETKSKQNNKVA
jgi:hypothetical protein